MKPESLLAAWGRRGEILADVGDEAIYGHGEMLKLEDSA